MKGLTEKQRLILNYIESFIEKNNFSPSYRELMQHFNFSSLGSVYKHIQTLIRKGALEQEKFTSRSIQIKKEVVQKNKEIELLLIGTLEAGLPINLFSKVEKIKVPSFLVSEPSNTYVLKAMGKGLQEDFIQEEDLILIEARNFAHPGETVLILVNGRETLIKKYFPKNSFVELQGINPNFRPLHLREESFQIQGVLVGLFRLY